MKEFDVSTWKRKTPYECFSKYSNPVFSMTARLDVTKLVELSKRQGTSFFANFIFVVAKCLNGLESFRLRIKEEKVVIYDVITPSYIVMNDKGVIVTKQTKFNENYKEFYNSVKQDIEEAKHNTTQKKFNNAGQNDVFYTDLYKSELEMYEEQSFPTAEKFNEVLDNHIKNPKFFSKDDFKLYQKGCDYFRSNQKDKTSVEAQADLLAYKTHVINVLGFYNFLTKENDIPEKHLLNYYFDEYFLNGEGLIKP